VKKKRAPCFGVLSHQIWPPWALTTALQNAKPRPVESCEDSFVSPNSVKIDGNNSGEIPAPSSQEEKRIAVRGSAKRASNRICVSGPLCLMALEVRLEKTRRSSRAAARRQGQLA
jgi:hypothetical protein